MKGNKNRNLLEYKEESEESYNDDNEFVDIEGENILLRDNKKKIKKDLNNFDAMQSELKKYEGKNISYNKLQNINEEEEIEDSGENGEIENEEDNENENIEKKEENQDKEEELKTKANILDTNKDQNEEEDGDEEKEENEEENSDEDNGLTLQEKMEKQDEQYLKTLSKVTKDEIRKAKNIINQKELYETFVGIRIALQNLL